IGPRRYLPVALDLAREGCRQVRIERDVEIFPIGKAGFASGTFARIERKARLDLRATERVSDDLVAAAHQPVPVSAFLAPEVERREAVRDRAEAADLTEQERL